MHKLVSKSMLVKPMNIIPHHWIQSRRLTPLVGLLLWLMALPSWGQGLQLATLDDLLTYADAHSAVAQTATAQAELARLQNAAALANTVNLRGNLSLSATDNFALPVNFIPAEIFGGPAGTFREVTFGQQFVNVAAIVPQLDVVNPSTWARVASARTSADLTATTNALNRRNLHENIAAAYYNYCSAKAQGQLALQNLAHADTIAAIVGRRYDSGVVRKQDLNNALANRANLADYAAQLETRAAQHLLTLHALLGLPAGTQLSLGNPPAVETGHDPSLRRATSVLLRRQSTLQAQLQRSELLASRLAFLPTISVVAGFNWQQNSNEGVFNDADWIRSQYVGLKLSMPLPTETRLWSQAEEYRINLRLKEIQAEQVAVQEAVQNQQLELEIDRAVQALTAAESIRALRDENYQRGMLNYVEGIVGEDQVLTMLMDLVNAQLAAENARWNLLLQLERLRIEN
jgi:outer membrane protein TolC